MAIRFKGENLEDNGVILDISYEELLKACLGDSYPTLSIREIVFAGVTKLTGRTDIVQYNYRQSELFIKLEQAIREDPEYLVTKARKMWMHQIVLNAKHEEQKVKYISPAELRRERVLLKGFYHKRGADYRNRD